jgi:hypothetical protein
LNARQIEQEVGKVTCGDQRCFHHRNAGDGGSGCG